MATFSFWEGNKVFCLPICGMYDRVGGLRFPEENLTWVFKNKT